MAAASQLFKESWDDKKEDRAVMPIPVAARNNPGKLIEGIFIPLPYDPLSMESN